MRQRIPGREKMPGTELGPDLVPKKNKAKRIWIRTYAQLISLTPTFPESSGQCSTSFQHNGIDCDLGGHSPMPCPKINSTPLQFVSWECRGYQRSPELQQSLRARAQPQPLPSGFTRLEHQTILVQVLAAEEQQSWACEEILTASLPWPEGMRNFWQ